MLITPNNLVCFQVLGDDLPNELFHHFYRDESEADWLGVSQTLLLVLSEDRS